MKKLHIVTAGMLMCSISANAYNPWADMQKNFEEMKKTMEKTFAQIHEEMQVMANEAQEGSKRSSTPRYTLDTETLQRDGTSLFVVKATLPDMKQKDVEIAVTVDIDDNGKQVKKLEISSVQREEEKAKVTKKIKKNSTVVQSYSSLMQNSSWANGLGRTVRFDNGVLKMTADLPNAVDENSYVTKFDEDTKELVIEFVQTVTVPKKIKINL